MYLAEKHRIRISLAETLDHIDSSIKYVVVDLNPEILRAAETIQIHELHDRLILATAKWLGVQVISSDADFKKLEDIQVIWN